MRQNFKSFSLYAYISTLFLALLFSFAGVTIFTQYVQTKNMLLSSAEQVFQRVGEETGLALNGISDPAKLTVRLLSRSHLVEANTEESRLTYVPLLAEALQSGTGLSAVYMGYDNGDFIAARIIDPKSNWGRSIKPPDGAVFLVQSMARDSEGLRSGRFLFYDKDMLLLADRPMPNYVYDPRRRAWFNAATATSGAVRGDPYLFFTTREVGVTLSQRSLDGHAVAGVDVTLGSLANLLVRSKATASSQLVIMDTTGHVLASSAGSSPLMVDDIGTPILLTVAELHQPVLERIVADYAATHTAITAIDVGATRWETFYAPLTTGADPIYLAIATPQSEILAEADRIRRFMLLLGLAALVVATFIALSLSRLISRSLDNLTTAARDINALKFDRPFKANSFIVEIDRLAQAMGAMKETISRLLAIGAVLGGEKRFDRLLDRIVAETISVAGARGGIVYLAEPDGTLKGGLARFDNRLLTGSPPPELKPGENADHPAIQASAGSTVQALVTPEQVARWYPNFEHPRHFMTLSIPLKNRQDDLVGVLMLSQDPDVERDADQADIVAFVEAVSGTAAVAIETNRLIQEQKRLMVGIIELVAGAIDAKSPYTGGHCQRVPALTEMLARAAVDSTEGTFKDFSLNEEQWEELHLAGWLHDCGKVTSPEFVIDKATKLETIYDRLHEIRMRFEVIKRESEVTCWREIADARLTGVARDARLKELHTLWDQLDDEFSFVATSNLGGEFMAPERVERLVKIAGRTWTRTLDDRIGLSHEESERRGRLEQAALPTIEPLLADRPEHIIPRTSRDKVAADNPWGFKMKIPELLYNRGELYNLTVARGTLTDEERFKINEHMIETIRMLTRLPLPRHLRNVPEIAGGHHEKMDGTGYPKRLRREEMSIPARMMAIADIFEALTAADRPYKKAKSLSDSIGIMAKMRDDAHIDPDLFALFLTSGVYRRYAEMFLKPEQIDDVPVERYLKAG